MEMEGIMQPSLIQMKLLTALPNIFSVNLSWVSEVFNNNMEYVQHLEEAIAQPLDPIID